MKPKKNLLSLFALWIILWGLYAGYMYYLAQGGIHHHAYGGLSVKTMMIALGVVSFVLSIAWFFIWRVAHESQQQMRATIERQLEAESQPESNDSD